MCCFHMDIARKGGGVKACQDGLGPFFSTFARLTEGAGSKAVLAMPIWNQLISKRGFTYWNHIDMSSIWQRDTYHAPYCKIPNKNKQ